MGVYPTFGLVDIDSEFWAMGNLGVGLNVSVQPVYYGIQVE